MHQEHSGKLTRLRVPLRALALLSLIVGSLGCASIAEHQRNVASKSNTTRLERMVWEHEGFLRHHPDIKYRKLGFWYQDQGDIERSLDAFRTASRYADKASQAVLAEAHFQGRGVPRDLPRAYAFMDLAAERAYPLYLAKRERYWAAMDLDQRQQALRIGRELYDEYGDAVAKPRIARVLSYGRRQTTGSRLAAPPFLQVLLPIDGLLVSVPGNVYYRKHFWQAEQYFDWFDGLHREPPTGNVEVGPMRPEQETADAQSPG